ncbi:MAG: hypothetical protein GF347_03445 [Candidatus Moranbacteria bacterium]|nr:hypothetical protein [Candidatus Moranbacteria bacterium]
MSSLPIKLEFFRKLELYQEVIFENNKSKKAGQEALREVWNFEKAFLEWAATEHHHRSQPLDDARIVEEILNLYQKKKEAISETLVEKEVANVRKNMISRGFAKNSKGSIGIIITKEGFLMGRVLSDLNKKRNRAFYRIFIFLTWAVPITASLMLFINFFEKLIDFYN